MKKSTDIIIKELYSRYPKTIFNKEEIQKSINLMASIYKKDKKVLTCGNGGSASDAIHITGELMKKFIIARNLKNEEMEKIKFLCGEDSDYIISKLEGALPAIALVNNMALITAISNDTASEMIFAQQIYGIGREGDILLAISTSGNSKNVIYAAKVAKVCGMKVIALTGKDGGMIKGIADILINVQETETYRVQELHIPIYHTICAALENEFFGGDF